MSRYRAGFARVGGCAVVLALAASFLPPLVLQSAAAGRAPTTPPLIIVYGDSLIEQSSPYLLEEAAAKGVQLIVRSYGGTAPCDWLDDAAADAALHPAMVAVSFVGNAITPCIVDRATSVDDLLVAYRADVTQLLSEFPNAKRLLALQPPLQPGLPIEERTERLNGTYQQVARGLGVRLVNGLGQVTSDGDYALRLPAVGPAEQAQADAAGMVTVRATDGAHFDVQADGTSWGARRFAHGLAVEVCRSWWGFPSRYQFAPGGLPFRPGWLEGEAPSAPSSRCERPTT